jgi:hypothetical protein
MFCQHEFTIESSDRHDAGMQLGLGRLPGVLDEKRSIMEIPRHYTTVEGIKQPSVEAVIHGVEEPTMAGQTILILRVVG